MFTIIEHKKTDQLFLNYENNLLLTLVIIYLFKKFFDPKAIMQKSPLDERIVCFIFFIFLWNIEKSIVDGAMQLIGLFTIDLSKF